MASLTLTDPQRSGQLTVEASSQRLTQRRTLPFGGPLGTEPYPWPGVRNVVGIHTYYVGAAGHRSWCTTRAGSSPAGPRTR
ncbi:hypothetical protein [Streptomyces sp. NPDC006997]|uniref:hypothetical protein n=1 Tax=Streptomyces sp. NPDC006997 TaxID=3155356 RepID=UPI0033E6D07F